MEDSRTNPTENVDPMEFQEDEPPTDGPPLSPISHKSPVFAAYIPNSPKRHVFTEFKQLKSFLDSPECKKLNTSARFKRCKNNDELDSFYIEAEDSELNNTSNSLASTSSPQSSGEFKSPFSEPLPPMLNQFRRAIEGKNVEHFEGLLADNPRFILNTTADGPTILQGSQRQNALHVACAYGNVSVAQKVLGLLQDQSFLERAYGSNNFAQLELIEQHLRDGFLNTPDKVANNTPLHFAARGGYVEIVESLLLFPECLRDRPNRYEKTPFDVICEAYKGPAAKKAEIKKQLSKLLRKTSSKEISSTEVLSPSPPFADFSKLKLSPNGPQTEESPVKSGGGGDAEEEPIKSEESAESDEPAESEEQTASALRLTITRLMTCSMSDGRRDA